MRLLFLFSSLFLCFLTTAQKVQYQSLIINEALTNNANAVVRLDEMKINLLATNKMSYSVKQVVTVLNKDGNNFAFSRVSYDKESKIKSLDVYVYDRLGKEIDHIKKKDFKDVSAADGISLYTDNRMLYNRYTPTSYPYTISFNYDIETSDTGFFPPWYFLSNYKVSVEQSYYEINYANAELKPEIKEFNLEDISVSKKDEAGQIVYQSANILAIKSESLGPSFRDVVPRLKVRLKKFNLKGEEAVVEDWKGMGSWMNASLLKDRDLLNPATIEIAKKLVIGVDDDLEKAKIIYKYVQDNTRYISVQIGIGGWKPISAIDVDRVKYGDCKGLSNYTYALLKAVGVKAYYTIIHAGNRKVDFEEDFAALQGNHAILAIPYNEQYYWIDCTSQVHPFGFVGDFTDDRKALVVKPEGGEIVRTVAYINEDNYQFTKAKYELAIDGSISGKISISTKGIQYDDRFGLERKTKDDVIKHYKSYWDNINNLKINTYSFKNDRDDVVFSEKIDINAANYGSISGSRILFAVNSFNSNGFVPNRYRNRKLPFEIQRGFLDEDEFTVQLPEGYLIEAIPEEKLVDTDFGSYKVSFESITDSNSILYKRRLFIKKGMYAKEKYAEYRDFRKETAKMDNAQIVLVKK
jgi:transglutaminase-like putative cysteine protease